MIRHYLSLAALVALSGASPAQAHRDCTMSPDDGKWVADAFRASQLVMLQRLHLPRDPRPTIVLFDKNCRFETKLADRGKWVGITHEGRILLPDGNHVDVGVTSFASRDDRTGERFFVMALPSIWYAAKVMKPADLGLIGVFLHEFSHTRQMDVLRPRFDTASAIRPLPEDFTDDTIQKTFQANADYAQSIAREIELLYKAADEPDEAEARSLARHALGVMETRQTQFFTGKNAWLRPYDDLFLTMEGFGQWAAYAWLSDAKGGRMTPLAARDRMRGSRRWWSQDQGLALFLVIDRLLPAWPQQAFGSRPALAIELLREAVDAAPPQKRLQ